MKEIELTHNLFALVDDEDYERMNQWNWHVLILDKKEGLQRTPKIARTTPEGDVEFGEALLEYNKEIEFLTFINHNRFDFTRKNLFLVPIEYARLHNLAQSNSSSKYKGVSYASAKKRYLAAFHLDGKKHYIGSSKNEDAAAIMYNNYTKELFGEYAFQNIIGQDNRKPVFEELENHQPRSKKLTSKKWRGVLSKKGGYFHATIKGEHLGTFDTAEDAAYAYNQRAIELYGDQAILNELPVGFVGQPKRLEIQLFGETYYSLVDIAKAYGIPKTTLPNRLKTMSLEEAVLLGKPEPRLKLEGKSMRQIALEHGISRHKLSALIKEGNSVEDAINQLKQTKKE